MQIRNTLVTSVREECPIVFKELLMSLSVFFVCLKHPFVAEFLEFCIILAKTEEVWSYTRVGPGLVYMYYRQNILHNQILNSPFSKMTYSN